jgi:hypothetical protein
MVKDLLNTNTTITKGETTPIQTKTSLDLKHIITIDQVIKLKMTIKTILGPAFLSLVLRNYVSCFVTPPK